MDNGLIFPYPCTAARAAVADVKLAGRTALRGGKDQGEPERRAVSRRGDAGGQLYRAVVDPE